jgi:hypothetical protein
MNPAPKRRGRPPKKTAAPTPEPTPTEELTFAARVDNVHSNRHGKTAFAYAMGKRQSIPVPESCNIGDTVHVTVKVEAGESE